MFRGPGIWPAKKVYDWSVCFLYDRPVIGPRLAYACNDPFGRTLLGIHFTSRMYVFSFVSLWKAVSSTCPFRRTLSVLAFRPKFHFTRTDVSVCQNLCAFICIDREAIQPTPALKSLGFTQSALSVRSGIFQLQTRRHWPSEQHSSSVHI